MDVREWLEALELGAYAPVFEENAIDADVLAELSDADLRELGVSAMGHRKKILKAIASLETRPADEPGRERPQQDAPAVAATPDPERRQLTVMFCDLVSSTELSERFDPEDLGEIVRAYQRASADVVERFDGYIARYMGDGLLVYFGYPHAHEDDVPRALEAALGILDAVTGLEVRPGLRLQVRIGVATGPVVVGESVGSGEAREQVVLGETPNLAARLQGLAASHTVLIADPTRRLVGERFACVDLGMHTLKGFTDSVRAWRVDAARDANEPAPDRAVMSAMVARDHELAILADSWRRARHGSGQVVVITGEPGIGKSRLVDEMRASASGGEVAQVVFHCSAHHTSSALHPVRRHLERLLGFSVADGDVERWAKLESKLRGYRFANNDVLALFARLLSVSLPAGRTLQGLTPDQEREQTRAALVAWLAEDAERRPVLHVWEDLHWADPSSLDLLGAIIDQTPGLHMLTLLTARPEFEAPWRARTHLTQLSLNRLGPADVNAIVTRVARGKRLPGAVVDEILARVDGIPLFVEEMTKAVLESPAMVEREGAFVLVGSIDAVSIPISLHDSLTARLDRIGAAKRAAQIASVIGRQVEYRLLQAVAPLDEVTLRTHLQQLVDAELLYPRGTLPDAVYFFRHALIQDAAYESLLRKTRQALHDAIAQALETPERENKGAALLAFHLARGAQPQRAIPHALAAGEHAAGLHARAEATSHFTHALELARAAPESAEVRRHTIDAVLKLASVASSGADMERDRMNLAEAQALAETLGDAERLAQVVYWRGRIAYIGGDVDSSGSFAERSLAIADDLGNERLAAPPVNLLGRVALLRGDFVRGADLMIRNAAQMRSIGDVVEESTASAFAAFYLALQGRFDEAERHEARSVALVETLEDPFARASVLFMQANNRHLRGRWTEAYAGHEESRRVAEEMGDRFRLYTSCLWESLARIDAGDARGANPLCGRAASLGEQLGTAFQRDLLLAAQGACRLAEGDVTNALKLSAEAVEYATSSSSRIGLGYAQRIHGLASVESDLEQATASMNEAVRSFSEIRALPSLARSHRDFALTLAAVASKAAAEHHRAAVELFADLGLDEEWEQAHGHAVARGAPR